MTDKTELAKTIITSLIKGDTEAAKEAFSDAFALAAKEKMTPSTEKQEQQPEEE